MSEGNFLEPVVDKSKDLSQHGLGCLIDALFLVAWFLINVKVDHFLDRYQLKGADLVTLHVLQVAFAIATIAPVAIYILKDLCILGIRSGREVKEVWRGKTSGSTKGLPVGSTGGAE